MLVMVMILILDCLRVGAVLVDIDQAWFFVSRYRFGQKSQCILLVTLGRE